MIPHRFLGTPLDSYGIPRNALLIREDLQRSNQHHWPAENHIAASHFLAFPLGIPRKCVPIMGMPRESFTGALFPKTALKRNCQTTLKPWTQGRNAKKGPYPPPPLNGRYVFPLEAFRLKAISKENWFYQTKSNQLA